MTTSVLDSILDSTKKNLGIDPSYTVYDSDVVMHINSVFSMLNQLGLGPVNGYMIDDSTATWDAFIGEDLRLNQVKTYVYLRVRILFDPPQTAHHLNAVNDQIRQLEWYLNVHREETAWTDPNST